MKFDRAHFYESDGKLHGEAEYQVGGTTFRFKLSSSLLGELRELIRTDVHDQAMDAAASIKKELEGEG